MASRSRITIDAQASTIAPALTVDDGAQIASAIAATASVVAAVRVATMMTNLSSRVGGL